MTFLRLPAALAFAALSVTHAASERTADRWHLPGRFAVDAIKLEWTDTARARQVPVKIYTPKNGPGLFPVIVFSHGLGGTREGYEYLGRHWTSHGYVSVHLQHPGSDDAVWRGTLRPMKAMREAAANPRNAIDRALDVHFAIDRIIALNAEAGRFQQRFDTNRVGLAGHSFGAHTTLAVAGQRFGLSERTLGDPRVKAGIAMSPPASKRTLASGFERISIPIFHMTGSEDDSPIGDTKAADRLIPFDRIQGADQYLLIFTGGDHMVYSGRSGWRGNRRKDAVFHDLIRASSTAFWEAYLRGDTKAKEWLAGGAFKQMLNNDGTFETKKALR